MADREQKRDPPPGEFISEDLRTETARFLDELKRRLGRDKTKDGLKLGPPKQQSPRKRD